jgi:alkanesulfonate monooxygenase SsuD/methylene tetrahydromethanopterin reductase-like flavin-dependent oxidoreductase (luciferase family)
MEFGASICFTDYWITPAELAVALEKRGFDSVWAAEQLHIPVPRRRRRRAAASSTIAITR